MHTSSNLPCPAEQIDAFLAAPTQGAIDSLSRNEGDVIVLGAAGKMGITLCLMLRDALKGRARVIAVSRFSDAASRTKFEGIETISCDLLDRDAVQNLPHAPNVFFLAGQKFGTSYSPEITWAMNALVPAHVAEKFRRSRIVAFSTGCVYPFTTVLSGGSLETDPIAPAGDYASSCAARERIFTYYSKKHQTPVCIYRLNYSVELRYGVLTDIAQRILGGEEIDVSMGYVNVIWQRDAVARAIQCLDQTSCPPSVMNVTGPEIVSIRQLALRLGAALGREPRFTGTEASSSWLSNAGRSFQLWGYPSVSLDQMIEWTAAWMGGGGSTLNKPTHFETRDGQF